MIKADNQERFENRDKEKEVLTGQPADNGKTACEQINHALNIKAECSEKGYPPVKELKEIFIKEIYQCKDPAERNALISRYEKSYDLLDIFSESSGVKKDVELQKDLEDYKSFFKSASILLMNMKTNSNFVNRYTNEQATPHDIVLAKMFIFDASSPKEAVEKMREIYGKK